MSIARRKIFELQHKLAGLAAEFQSWRDESEAQKPLEKHHTQIRRITVQLGGLQAVIRQELQAVTGSEGQILTACREIEQMILELHRIWEFFRSKLALRSVPWFKNYLIAADELAWFCYHAAQQKTPPAHIPREAIKEPPLVFFNGGSSPFTHSRNWAYRAEDVADEGLQTPEFIQVLKALPIPVIGIPWFQIQHLPEALIIAHEVGHNVEDDLKLTGRLKALLETALAAEQIPPGRQEAWKSWLGEIFADINGCLALGPAFVGTLMDFLATDQSIVKQDKRIPPNWGLYPPDYLRILLNIETLSQQQFPTESQAMKTEWTVSYSSHAMPEFEPDIPVIVKALLQGPYPELGGAALTDVNSFSAADQQQALKAANQALANYALQSEKVHILMAGARLAFEKDPEKYHTQKVAKRIIERVLAAQQIGVRAEDRRRRPRELQALDTYDNAAGKKLFQRIRELRLL